MDADMLDVRRSTYRLFVELTRAPTVDEVAADCGRAQARVRAAWRALDEAHALVLDRATGDLRMANPFSAVPTPYRVHVGARSYFANCAWDAFGICAALHTDGRIEATCADCGDPLRVGVRDERPDETALLFHCLVPAKLWWEDIVFT